ncbi:fatty acid desaturase [Sphingomonas sp. BK235]|uniref:fatty acid desaturase n=1 Tax=Sphingomonas sp. BK235 TaxID=2512131 RepID=UPI001043561F|nr:fatty acid desaturase [Sphingomonas sp. BK235]TCP35077.1 fatty acid desaturase [Sphingomonas sp. BK235]
MSTRATEWPTVALAATIYLGWITLTAAQAWLPTPVVVVAGAWLVAWHGSLQHETIHGHPTRFPRINALIGAVPLSLWLPYAIYHDSHLTHHRSAHVTHPDHDPESKYIRGAAGAARLAAAAQSTLLGRLILGPPLAVLALASGEWRRARRAPLLLLRDWVPHLAGVAVIAAWLELTGLGVWRYLLLVVYPATALTLLRSFAEHRADLPGPSRAATVERGGLLGLLYLNNHLHTAHHDRPDLAWYRLPAHQRADRARLIAQAGAVHASYGAIVRRYALRRHDALVHPGVRER